MILTSYLELPEFGQCNTERINYPIQGLEGPNRPFPFLNYQNRTAINDYNIQDNRRRKISTNLYRKADQIKHLNRETKFKRRVNNGNQSS